MTRLDRYVARTFLSSWLLSVVFFVGLYGVYDFFARFDDLMDEFQGPDTGLVAVGRLYLYQLPGIFLRVAPFVMVMSALIAVLRLQRHNEFLAMVFTGRSPKRILRPVFVLTCVFILGLVWIQEGLAPRVSVERDVLKERLLEKRQTRVIESITLRDASGKLFVAKDYAVEDEQIRLLNVSYEDDSGRNINISGERVVYDATGGGWRIQEKGKMIVRHPSSNQSIEDSAPFVRTDIQPEDLLVEMREPFDLSLAQVIDRARRYPNSRRYRLLLHYHVTFPLSILLLVFLALPTVLRRPTESPLRGLGISILLCLGFLILDGMLRDLANRGFMQPVLAAWLPVIVAGSLATVLFDTLER